MRERAADPRRLRGILAWPTCPVAQRHDLGWPEGADHHHLVDDAESTTKTYIRRFVEFSLFGRYFAFIIDLLGSHKSIRRDVYFKLKAYGIDQMAIDITLFAAMFSIGTLLMRAVGDVQRFGIDYDGLTPEQKRRFVTEVLRLYPTVTSVHRILEQPEIVRVSNRDLALTPGDEVVYPFICSNRDPRAFRDPDRIVLDRTAEEYDRVLSARPACLPGQGNVDRGTVVMLTRSPTLPARPAPIWNLRL